MKKIAALLLLVLVAGSVFAISPFKDKVISALQSEKASKRPEEAGRVRPTASGYVEATKVANGSLAWKGIPYAQAPLGQNRWRAPKLAHPWAGVRQTITSGPPCFQFGPHPNPRIEISGGSEDCLTLDVHAPEGSTSVSGLPVLFWIHGGNNSAGKPLDFDESLLLANHNVIVVSPSYRLGGFGWFTHQTLQEKGEESGNFGLLDLLFALEWVKANIWAFGGDPENVMLIGETSGADNVLALLTSPKGEELFHKAFVSNPGRSPLSPRFGEGFTGPDTNSANEVIARLLMSDGLVRSRGGAQRYIADMAPDAIARYLRAKAGSDFLAAYERAVDTAPFDIPSNFRDGHVLPSDLQMDVFKDRGTYNAVPIMLGSGRDFAKSDMMADPAHVALNSFQSPIPKNMLSYDRIAYYRGLGHRFLRVDALADLFLSGGNSDIYVFRFDWDEEGEQLGSDYGFLMGSSAQVEVPFLIGGFNNAPGGNGVFSASGAETRDRLSADMMSYLASFAHMGKPAKGSERQPARDRALWSKWVVGELGQKKLIFDSEPGGGTRMSAKRVTADVITSEIAYDNSLSTPKQKCAMASFLNNRYRIWSGEEFAGLFDGACKGQ